MVESSSELNDRVHGSIIPSSIERPSRIATQAGQRLEAVRQEDRFEDVDIGQIGACRVEPGHNGPGRIILSNFGQCRRILHLKRFDKHLKVQVSPSRMPRSRVSLAIS